MSIVFTADGSVLDPERVRLVGSDNAGGVGGLPSMAFGGQSSVASVQIEDPEGNLQLEGWRPFTVDETDCSKPRTFTGWIVNKSINRGAYRTGPGRVLDCDIIDQNEVFHFKVYRASSAKRPAETDLARVTFAMGSAPLSGLIHDNGLVNVTDNPILFGDSDYITQYPAELFASIAGTAGKNFYAYWDDTAGEVSMFYDQMEATVRTSSLRISNDRSDVDGTTTFFPQIDANLIQNPENTYSGLLLGYLGGYVYDQNATTIANHIDRDQVYRTDRVGKLATANALLAQMLVDLSTERDTITCTVRLPSSKVNLLHAGERVEVKFVHLPGYDDFVFSRVIRRNVIPSAGRRDIYDVQLELSIAGPSRGPGSGRGVGVEGRPHEGSEGHYYEGSFTFNEDSGGWSGPQPTGDPDDTTVSSTNTAGALFADSTTYNYEITMEVPNPGDYSAGIGLNTIFANPVVDAFGFPGFTGIPPAIIGAPSFTISGSFTTGDVNNVTVMQVSASVAGTHGSTLPVTVTFWIDPDGWEGAIPPAPGQEVTDEQPLGDVDGSNTVFNTTFPYADGTLRVWIDGVPIINGFTETDPEGAEFTLDFAPLGASGDTRAELITVRYQSR